VAVREARRDVEQVGQVHDRPGAELPQERRDLVTLLVAQQDDDPGRVGAATAGCLRAGTHELGLERLRLAAVHGHARHVAAAVRDARHDRVHHLRPLPAPQVAEGLLDRDPLRVPGRDPPDAAQRVVGPVARGPDDRGDRRRPPGCAAGKARGDLEDRRGTGLVVGEVHDHDARAEPVQVEPPRRELGRWPERAEAVTDLVDGRAQRPRAGGGRDDVRNVVTGEAGERDRDVDGLGDQALLGARELEDSAAALAVRPPARRAVAPHERRAVGVEREQRDGGLDAAGHRRHQRVVRVEHDPALGSGDARDRGLDLEQLRERVDPLDVEVVRGDVREDARVVGLVAHAPEHDAAAGGLEHGDIDV
jgi:hypothetical protein